MENVKVAGVQGVVEVLHRGATTWAPAQTNEVLYPFDELRTGMNGRAALLWPEQSAVPIGSATEIEVLPPASQNDECGLHLIRGVISFFHRDNPGHIQIITRGAMAGVEGTEFVLAADGAGETTMSVIDGRVRFGSTRATLLLTNGQQAIVQAGNAPIRTDGFIANNLLQWCFYYPAVLDPAELELTPAEQSDLAASLDEYRDGDILKALEKFPAHSSGSDAEKIYQAALFLSVGHVDDAEVALSSLSGNSEHNQRLAGALRELIAAVKRQQNPSPFQPKLATELLAASYYEQSLADGDASLKAALNLAERAVDVSPRFSFARERVAELEFSFGHVNDAMDTLDTSFILATQNPEALSLRGFLLAAQNRPRDAIVSFDAALAVDPALGNAWLGRGLCKIRLNDAKGGHNDLLMAAALEPQRAELRNYLGKAYANAGDFTHATHEFRLAEKLDPNDPTAWLYSALLDQERNQINDAIRDLEKSEAMNDNRSVYRSQLLLDQDQAVRAANLATMYHDAGMDDVSVREAARAVNYDYANYSAHHFLADSYEAMSDPNGINLRYETPAESEYLVANLLAPVSAGTLSPTISQGEYSKLFDQNGPGVVSDTEYLSRGAWTESGAQFGTYGNFSYDVEAYYRSDPGQWVNNDIEQRQLSLTLKQQLTPQDSVYFNAQQYTADFGDVSQYYNQSMANPQARQKETQNPIISFGYDHEWNPGIHTLFFAARLNDTYSLTNPAQPTLLEAIFPIPGIVAVQGLSTPENYQNQLNIYTAEVQQIWEQAAHTTIVGARLQYGHFNTSNVQEPSPALPAPFSSPLAADQNVSSLFSRISAYGYHQWQIFEPLQLIGGIAYDHITFPEDFRTAPILGNDATEDQISPKAGMIWTPLENTTVRFAYTRSLSGASLDQSFQIEPSQVAGFIQNYRSVIPESIAGANAGAKFETYDLSLEQKFHTGTYLGVSGEILYSTVDRVDGAFDYSPSVAQFAFPAGMNEDLNYQEKTLQVTANQLLGECWSFGATYRLSQAVLNDLFPGVPDNIYFGSPPSFQPSQKTRGLLNQLDLTAIYNHPSGFFAEGEAFWFGQNNYGYSPAEPGDSFCQFNLFGGYHFLRRRGEVTLGVLNLSGQDYNLNPLNIYNELPRSRTLVARLQLDF
jgi:outer membrane receptor protein involved in Fe transport/Tfp pilus assembly protein PilF